MGTDDLLEFRIGTADLRRGLAAVTPHMATDREAPDEQKRVRFELLASCAGRSCELLMMATDGWTAGCYAAEAIDVVTLNGAPTFLELTTQDIGKVLAVFKADGQGADDGGSVLRISVLEKVTTIRDVSGLFEGYELELPTTIPGAFPDMGGVLHRLTAGKAVTVTRPGARMQLGRAALERFGKTAKALGSPITIERRGGPALVIIGGTFVGAMVPARLGDTEHAEIDDTVHGWGVSLTRLTGMVRDREDQPAMFEPGHVVGAEYDATVEPAEPLADEPDDPGPVTPEPVSDDPGPAEDDVVPTDWGSIGGPAFVDSDGHAWPTVDPFAAPSSDPFSDTE